MVNKIEVALGARSYPVMVGVGMEKNLQSLLSAHTSTGRLFVVYDGQFYALHAPALRRKVRRLGGKAEELVIPSGEKAKSVGTIQRLHDFFIAGGITRSDFILAVGGGVTSDLVGFAAATIHRGIRWGVVSTTLLGMVDAAIGGKTGVNHKAGKNLIGAFWQPSFVCSDIGFLHTLPAREMVCGLGEIVKYCGLVGDSMNKPVNSYFEAGNLYDEGALMSLVALAAAYKAAVVSVDEREGSVRMNLNLGHTIGHAIEQSLGYGRLLHGEAVFLGLAASVELSGLYNPQARDRLIQYGELVGHCLGLVPHRKIDPEALLQALNTDKKRKGSIQRFVLLDGPGKPFIAEHPKKRMVRKAVEGMLSAYTEAKECHD